MLWTLMTALLLWIPQEAPGQSPEPRIPAPPARVAEAPPPAPGRVRDVRLERASESEDETDDASPMEDVGFMEADAHEPHVEARRLLQQVRQSLERLGPHSAAFNEEVQRLRRSRRRISDSELRGIVERVLQRAVMEDQLSLAAGAVASPATPQRAQAVALTVRDQELALRNVHAVLRKRSAWSDFRRNFEDRWRNSGKDGSDLSAALVEALSEEGVLSALTEMAAEADAHELSSLDANVKVNRRRGFPPVVVAIGAVCAAYAVLRGIARPARMG